MINCSSEHHQIQKSSEKVAPKNTDPYHIKHLSQPHQIEILLDHGRTSGCSGRWVVGGWVVTWMGGRANGWSGGWIVGRMGGRAVGLVGR